VGRCAGHSNIGSGEANNAVNGTIGMPSNGDKSANKSKQCSNQRPNGLYGGIITYCNGCLSSNAWDLRIFTLGQAPKLSWQATWRTSTGPRFSMVIGLAQLFNSVREKHVVHFIDRFSLQTKDWKALHMSQICKHVVLDRKSFRTVYLLG
jgi:hypothetical protein